MTQVLYTTTDAIRAALGVTAREITDTQVTDLGISDQLLFSLEKVYPAHVALSQAQGSSPTDAQVRLYKALVLFCQYEGAYIMTDQLQTLIAQKITDGDAEMQRFMKDNLKDTIARILAARNRWANILNAGSDIPVDTSIVPVMFSTVQPSYDPVANTGTNPSTPA